MLKTYRFQERSQSELQRELDNFLCDYEREDIVTIQYAISPCNHSPNYHCAIVVVDEQEWINNNNVRIVMRG